MLIKWFLKIYFKPPCRASVGLRSQFYWATLGFQGGTFLETGTITITENDDRIVTLVLTMRVMNLSVHHIVQYGDEKINVTKFVVMH